MSATFSSVKEVLSVVLCMCEISAVIRMAKNKVLKGNFSIKRWAAVIKP